MEREKSAEAVFNGANEEPPKDSLTGDPAGQKRFARTLLVVMLALCILPTILNFLGVSFGSPDPRNGEQEQTGSLIHMILEWSAVCAAMLTAALAFVHFRITRDIVTPIIGMALFWSGCMDAFHSLAAVHLVAPASDSSDFIPFTWAICRTFNALIPILVVVFLLHRRIRSIGHKRLGIVAGASIALGIIAFMVIRFSALSLDLPETMFPDNKITRPWDVAPLVLYLFSGLFVFRALHVRVRSAFSAALWISVIPDIATQTHMAFGSTDLFDNHFNIAHGLKVLSYLALCAGLFYEYILAHRSREAAVSRLQVTQAALVTQAVDLEQANAALESAHKRLEDRVVERTIALAQANKQLEREISERIAAQQITRRHQEELAHAARISTLGEMTAGIAHQLSQPLTAIHNYAQGCLERLRNGKATKEDFAYAIERVAKQATRAGNTIRNLRDFAQGRQSHHHRTDMNKVVQSALAALDAENGTVMGVPLRLELNSTPLFVSIDPIQIEQVIQNLLRNGVDAMLSTPAASRELIVQTAAAPEEQVMVSVSDTGQGISDFTLDQLLEPFFTTKPSGMGIGLSVCRSILEAHDGSITACSNSLRGSTFQFLVPGIESKVAVGK